jgi:MoaA/NifB/PqqE/SkfB family radical SAM enzyme
MYKIESRWGHQEFIKVEWNLGKRCNYDCSYCPAVIHDNESPHTDLEILKRTVDKLATLPKPVRLSLTGGEPCVHPHIEQLIRYIKEKHMTLSITTNGTRKALWYSMQNVDQYVFSLHFEYDWENVLYTIKNVFDRSNGMYILVHVMAHQDRMTEVRSAVDLLDFHGIPYAIRRVRWTEGDHDLFDDMRYDQKDLDWILEHVSTVKPNCTIYVDGGTKLRHANDIIKLHLNKFKGWSCNAGIESLMINWDGDVHRATCRVGGSLGNIYEGTFNIPTEPVICDRNYCTCAADIPLTKFSLSDMGVGSATTENLGTDEAT